VKLTTIGSVVDCWRHCAKRVSLSLDGLGLSYLAVWLQIQRSTGQDECDILLCIC
jgi:hypothetical protein